jgi:hypothetical protein
MKPFGSDIKLPESSYDRHIKKIRKSLRKSLRKAKILKIFINE